VPGLTISVVDRDDDYLGIDVFVASSRFSGAARIYAGLDQLSAFAGHIEGFPKSPQDERRYDFGSTDPQIAGGFVSLHFHCVDAAGHPVIDVTIEDDDRWHPAATAKLEIGILAADLDRFVADLRRVEQSRAGEAVLPGAV
jgi:hypothetical protein